MVFVLFQLPVLLFGSRLIVDSANKILDAREAKRRLDKTEEPVQLQFNLVVPKATADELLVDPRIVRGSWLAEKLKDGGLDG